VCAALPVQSRGAVLGDLLVALPIGLLGSAVLVHALSRPDDRVGRGVFFALAGVLALVVAAQLGGGLRGYRSDLWMYLTMAGRIAEGEWLFDVDPYGLQPPSIRTQSLVPVAAALSIVFLTAAAWRLASVASDRRRVRWLALLCFGLGLHQEWAALALNRNVALGFVLLATARALDFRGRPRDVVALAACVAAAFYTHLFGGCLAAGGAVLASAARLVRRAPLHLPALAAAGAGALLLAAPWLLLALPPDAPLVVEHQRGPGQFDLGGLRALQPLPLYHFLSPALALAAAAALWVRRRLALRAEAATLSWLAPAAVGALLFAPPLYHLLSGLFGGWMVPRLLTITFLWLPAAAALDALTREDRPRGGRALAALLAFALFWAGGARVVRDFREPALYAPFTAEARAEARGLREMLQRQHYLSSAYLAYGLAPFTLGHPLAVPPGHGSQYHPFGERSRDVHATFAASAPACWARLFARYPGQRYLVTPAPGATSERAVWRAEVPDRSPEEVRRSLEEVGAARRVFEGAHFVVDVLDPAALRADPADCTAPPSAPAGTR